MKKKLIIVTVLIILAFIVLLILLFGISHTPKVNIVGSWTNDDITIYKFNKDGTGAMVVSTTEYKFTYKLNGDILTIDFENEGLTDAKYTYVLESERLTLNGENNTFTFKRKQ